VGIRCADHATLSIPKSWHYLRRRGRSVGFVRLRTKATEFFILKVSAVVCRDIYNESASTWKLLGPKFLSSVFYANLGPCLDTVVPGMSRCLCVSRKYLFCSLDNGEISLHELSPKARAFGTAEVPPLDICWPI
jgi:hypothetical protein